MGRLFVVKVAAGHALKPLGCVEAGYDEQQVVAYLKEKYPWARNSTFVFAPADRESLADDIELIAIPRGFLTETTGADGGLL